jgi:hypothetical protein
MCVLQAWCQHGWWHRSRWPTDWGRLISPHRLLGLGLAFAYQLTCLYRPTGQVHEVLAIIWWNCCNNKMKAPVPFTLPPPGVDIVNTPQWPRLRDSHFGIEHRNAMLRTDIMCRLI